MGHSCEIKAGRLSRGDRLALAGAYIVSIVGLFALGVGTVVGLCVALGLAVARPTDAVMRHVRRIAAMNGAVLLCGLMIAGILHSWIFVRPPSGAEFGWGLAALALSVLLALGVKVALFLSMTRLADERS